MKTLILVVTLLGSLAGLAESTSVAPAYTLSCVDNPRVCVAHLTEHVEHQERYLGLFNEINQAKPGETILIYEHGYGGWTDTQEEFVRDVSQSKAKIFFMIDGDASSADAYISLSGNGLYVQNGAIFMFHDVQIGVHGTPDFNKDNAYDAAARHDFHTWIVQHDGDLLSKSELNYMFTNPNNSVYISGAEMVRRWNEVRVDHQPLTDPKETFSVED